VENLIFFARGYALICNPLSDAKKQQEDAGQRSLSISDSRKSWKICAFTHE